MRFHQCTLTIIIVICYGLRVILNRLSVQASYHFSLWFYADLHQCEFWNALQRRVRWTRHILPLEVLSKQPLCRYNIEITCASDCLTEPGSMTNINSISKTYFLFYISGLSCCRCNCISQRMSVDAKEANEPHSISHTVSLQTKF